jgi:predicted transposase YbfD/YdcC
METKSSLSVSKLLSGLSEIEDRRRGPNQQHELTELLAIALCALLSGAETFVEMEQFGRAQELWLRSFLEIKGGIPSHDTFGRVFAMIEPNQFQKWFMEWTQQIRRSFGGEVISIDGKSLRGSGKAGKELVHLVSAWAGENRLVLGQVRVAAKSNEITAIPLLVRQLDLRQCVVTIDAMGCQKAIAGEICQAQADYVLALKGNHATVSQEVRTFLDEAIARWENPPVVVSRDQPEVKLAHHQTVEKDHGRLEIRRYWITDQIQWLTEAKEWVGLRSFGLVESTREIAGVVTVERRCYLSSLPAKAQGFAQAVRGHWAVENSLHWTLDVTFNEDQCRVRTGHAAENFSTLRRMALNILKRETSLKSGLKCKQKYAGWNPSYLLKLLQLST